MENKLAFKLMQEEIDRINSLIGYNLINEQIGPNTLISGMSGLFDPLLGVKTFNWFSTFDKHDWATFVEITTGILGLIPSPASPLLLGISFAAGVTDAVFYFNEGDPYMGGLMLALAILPAAELMKVIPGAKSILSKGNKYVSDLLKSAKKLSGVKNLTKGQKTLISEAKKLISEVSKNAEILAKKVVNETVVKVISKIVIIGGKTLWGTCLLLSKISVAVGTPLVLVGGIYYTYDEIYLALYGDDKIKLKLRYNSRFQGLVRALKVLTNYESAQKQAQEYLEMNTEVLSKNPQFLVSIDTSKRQDAIKEYEMEISKKLKEKEEIEKIAPTFEQVLNQGRNSKSFVIKKGQKGDSVRKIQKMLDKLNLGSTLKNYNEELNGIDGVFGNNTMDAIILFQSLNNLRETGIVDNNTLRILIKKYKESLNEK